MTFVCAPSQAIKVKSFIGVQRILNSNRSLAKAKDAAGQSMLHVRLRQSVCVAVSAFVKHALVVCRSWRVCSTAATLRACWWSLEQPWTRKTRRVRLFAGWLGVCVCVCV